MTKSFNIFHRNHVVPATTWKTEEITDARKEYLNFCESEANSIYRNLLKEVLDEIKLSGKAYIHVVCRYDNIFKHHVAEKVKKMFEKQNIKINLFNSIGWIEAFNK